jgi:hypothetical protein
MYQEGLDSYCRFQKNIPTVGPIGPKICLFVKKRILQIGLDST